MSGPLLTPSKRIHIDPPSPDPNAYLLSEEYWEEEYHDDGDDVQGFEEIGDLDEIDEDLEEGLEGDIENLEEEDDDSSEDDELYDDILSDVVKFPDDKELAESRQRRYADLLVVNATLLHRMNTGMWYLSVYNDAIAQTQVRGRITSLFDQIMVNTWYCIFHLPCISYIPVTLIY